MNMTSLASSQVSNNDIARYTRRARCVVATLALGFAATGCSLLGGEETTAAPAAPVSTGSVDQLCATFAQWAQPLADAGGAGLTELASAKVGYLEAALVAAPADWADNIAIILPAWQTLVEVIVAAEGDASKIDFDKFRTDFADATANDAALDAFVSSRCVSS